MASSTTEADIEAQTGVVAALPANNAGTLSTDIKTDITPNPQPSPNHNPRVTNTNDPPSRNPLASQAAKNLEVLRGILTCPIHGL